MSSSRSAAAGFIVLSLPLISQAETTATPPVAKRVEHREARHGATVIDNYFWLREKSNPEVIDYLKAENVYTEALTKDLKPFEDALYKEMLGRIKQTDLSVPTRRGGFFFYSRTAKRKQNTAHCRPKGHREAPEKNFTDAQARAQEPTHLGMGPLP